MHFCFIQWDLVCDKNVLPEASQMVFNFGVMFGAILFGFLSDKFGRKRSFIFALVTQAIVGCATAASPNFYVFTILRFIVGALEQVLIAMVSPHLRLECYLAYGMHAVDQTVVSNSKPPNVLQLSNDH